MSIASGSALLGVRILAAFGTVLWPSGVLPALGSVGAIVAAVKAIADAVAALDGALADEVVVSAPAGGAASVEAAQRPVEAH